MTTGHMRGGPISASREVFECLQSLFVSAQRHIGLTQTVPVPRRIEIRVDLPGAFETGQTRLSLTEKRQHDAHVGGVPLVVGIDLNSPPHVLDRDLMRSAGRADVSQDGEASTIAAV